MVFYQPSNSAHGNYNVYRYENIYLRHHFHKNHEIIYVEKGEVEVQLNGDDAVLRAGDYLMITSNAVHYYSTPKESVSYVVVFSEDHVPEFSSELKGKVCPPIPFHCQENITEHLKKYLFDENAEEDRFMRIACLYMVCAEYLKSIPPAEKKEKNMLPIQKIVEYVEENYKNDITMSDVSKALGYEYHYFSRYFSSAFKMNFRAFLNSFRYARAVELIKKGDMNMTEIASESGFGSVRNFNRVYKSFAGKAPGEN